MGFSFRQALGPLVADALKPQHNCPTGKTPLPTKAAADRELRRINATLHMKMHRFRCGYCDQYHLGHARGRKGDR
jgi:hypothetical protein